MKCTGCKRLIEEGETYVVTKSEVGIAGEEILDSVDVIIRCMRKGCLLYAQVQMHPCLEVYHARSHQ